MTDALPTSPVAALFALSEGERVYAEARGYTWTRPWRVESVTDTGDERTVTVCPTHANGTPYTLTVTRDGQPPEIDAQRGCLHALRREPRETTPRPQTARTATVCVLEAAADPLSVREIAHRAGYSRVAISTALGHLVADGDVVRGRAAHDGRVFEYLLDSGASVAALSDAARAAQTLAARLGDWEPHPCPIDGCEYVGASDRGIPIHLSKAHGIGPDDRADTTDRCGACPPIGADAIVREIHRVRAHGDDPGDPLYGTHPDTIEATIRASETVADAAARMDIQGERVLRFIGALGLAHLVTPESCGVAWDSEGRATVGGEADD